MGIMLHTFLMWARHKKIQGLEGSNPWKIKR
jgi:hypothetical protein